MSELVRRDWHANEEDVCPLDDVNTSLPLAVSSLSDFELRELLLAFLTEWRNRHGDPLPPSN